MTIILKEKSERDDELSHKYHCDACEKDITFLVRFTCAPDLTATLASGNELDLCVDCFCSGVELKDHKRTHPFIIREALNYPLFEPTWTAQEELLMVDGMRTFGMGNWEQIADHVGSKDKYEVEAHYMRTYVESPTWPIPVRSKSLTLLLTTRLLFLLAILKSATSGPANHEIQGFMPAREEFETEFDNDAETAVKDMVFEETDTPQEVLLKTTILNIYNTTLDRRLERKRFIKDRGLTHDFRKILAVEKKRTREEKELLHRTRVLARLQTAADYELLLDGLFREQKLRHRIAELQEYRRMGMTTFKDAADYERDKIQRVGLHIQKLGAGAAAGSTSTPTTPSLTSHHQAAHPPQPAAAAGAGPVGMTPLPNTYRRGTVQPLDISTAESVELLLPNEQQLCSNLRIQPKAYLNIKETLLKEFTTTGVLQRKRAREMIKIDVNKTAAIYDLFVVNGWINP
ncbi:hypothetical protein DFJ73DRAFT_628669 [Zopfochytrium polystomum]|nr:hypothetical protein DFJ73DRAFT_628669 [Zopfochytrium polystomum]